MNVHSPQRASARELLTAMALGLATQGAVAALGGAPLPLSVTVAAPAAAASSQGGSAKSAKSASATAKQAVTRPYTMHETTLPSGTAIQEFATQAGVVFAVKWQGRTLPNLDELLGGYFPTFQAEAAQRRAAGIRGGALVVNAGGVLIRSSGRMGDFRGAAYVASLIPTGLNIDDVL